MLRQWIRQLLTRKVRPARGRVPARPPVRRYRAQLEALEDRFVPALSVTDLTAGVTPLQLVQTILGGGVQVSNIKFTGFTGSAGNDVKNGTSSSAGIFKGGTGIIGFECGLVLSSGGVQNVVGPNTTDGITQVNNLAGDPQLAALLPAGTPTFDATALEFDFVPSTSQLTFNYVFSSDEYNEFANSQFNDVFGFFLNNQNVALLPGTATPVSINNVNGGNPIGTGAKNPQFYINNDIASGAKLNTEMDGLTVVLPVKASVNAGQVNHIKLAVADAGDDVLDSNVFIEAGSFSSGAPSSQAGNLIATGTDAGAPPVVNVFNGQGTLLKSFLAYNAGFLGGVRVAVADVNGDGNQDVITVPGPGGPAVVRVFAGPTFDQLASFLAYTPGYFGGAYVAAADFNGDKFADLVISADSGSVSDVRLFSGLGLTQLSDFYAYGPFFTGGVRIAVGDINGDGVPDIITGAGPGAGPHVEAFSGGDLLAGKLTLLQSFFAYDPSFHGGVYVASANFGGTQTTACSTNSSVFDIVVGPGAGMAPEVKVFDGLSATLVKDFLADAGGFLFFPDGAPVQAGVRVSTTDTNGDRRPEILTSFGVPHAPDVRTWDFATLALIGDFFAYDPRFYGSGVLLAGAP